MLAFSVALVAGFAVSTAGPNAGPLQVEGRGPPVELVRPPQGPRAQALPASLREPGELEAQPLLGRRQSEPQSLGAVLGLLVAVACGLGSFVDGLAVLQRGSRDSHWQTVVRVLRAGIEAYTVGHLQFSGADRCRQPSDFAVYSLLAALPSGMLLRALFGQRLAPESAATLLLRWLLLSASFGLLCYVVAFHQINKAFDSSHRKKSLYSLFFLGQLVAAGLVCLSS